jgi:hypothetical protein
MANSIDFLKTTKSLNTDTSSITSENQTVKDKPSLFDSLLSGNKTNLTQDLSNSEEIKTDLASKTELKNSDLKEEIGKAKVTQGSVENKEISEVELEKDPKSKDSSVIKEEKLSRTSSLLDRLVLEAKKDLKTVNKEELKSLDNKTTVMLSLDNPKEINADSKTEEKNVNLKEEIGNIKNTLSLEENKEISEVDLQKNLKTVNKEDLRSLDNKTTVTESLDNSKEINADSKTEVKNINLKEEIGNIKNTLSLEENKETPEVDLKKDLKTASKEELKNLDSKIEEKNINLKEEIGNIKNTLSLEENKETPEVDLKKDLKTASKEELKNLDNKTSVIPSLDNSKEINTDSKTELKNINIKEEIGNIKNTLNSVENKEIPEIGLTKELKSILQEELNNLDKNIDVAVINADKNINIVKKESISTNIEIEVSTAGENIKKVQTTVENKIISSENKESIKTELNIEKIIVDSEKNITEDTRKTEDEDISNNTKINIPSTISVPLSDTLTSQSTSPLSNNVQVKSLMDQLIQKNTQSIESISPEKIDMMQRESASKDFISNIYLSTQKNSINTQNLFNKNEAVNLLKNATSINDVKTSAQMLDLGLEDISIDENLETQKNVDIPMKQSIDLVAKRTILDNLMLDKNIIDIDVKNLITKSVEASSALLDNTLALADDAVVTVNSPLSYNIQSKIIGARQQMSTMMSDIARQMYENYKPPVTVFKINLNPLELGSIAILMKNDKNNSLSISMNVSNNSTLDALIDNQNVLKTSLNKSFDENTKFNLNFSSSSENNSQSNNQSNENNQGNQSRFEQQIDTQSILELKEENKDREEKSIDYM